MGLATLKYFYCPWALMAFFFFLTGQGSFATFTAGYLPSLFNHHGKWRSRIMGVMVGAFAASSMIFAVIFRYRFRVSSGNVALEQHNLAMYLFVLGGVTSGVAFLCAFFVPMVGPAPQVLEEEPLQEDVTRDVSPLRLFTLLNFYLVFGAMFFVTGPGLLWITVQGSLAKSLHLESAVDILVLLLGAGSVIGRIGIGFISDLTARKISRAYYCEYLLLLLLFFFLLFSFFSYSSWCHHEFDSFVLCFFSKWRHSLSCCIVHGCRLWNCLYSGHHSHERLVWQAVCGHQHWNLEPGPCHW